MAKKKALTVYKAVIMAAGLLVMVAFTAIYPVKQIFSAAVFILLAVLAESQTVYMGEQKSVSISSAVHIAAMLVCGPAAAVWVAVATMFGSLTVIDGKKCHMFNTPAYVTLFNMSNYALSVAIMCWCYFHLGGALIPLHRGSPSEVLALVNANAVQLLVAIAATTVVNALLVFAYLAIQSGIGNFKPALTDLVWPTVNIFIIFFMGIFITVLYVSYGWFLVMLFFAPFMLARYVFITFKDLQHSYFQTVKSLASAIEAKDEYTSGHSRRVEKYSSAIAGEMKLSARRCETLRYAAVLHDIGKIGIPEAVLNKPGKLSDDEWALIKSHPEKGAHIVEEIEFLRDAAQIIRSHHEWVDGSGYPQGKDAQSLSVESMILTVADSYDAMTSDRPYRKRLSAATAASELHLRAGTQFSPEVVAAFERAFAKDESQFTD